MHLLSQTTQPMGDSPTNLYGLLGLLIVVVLGGPQIWSWLKERSKRAADASDQQAKTLWNSYQRMQEQLTALSAKVGRLEAEAESQRAETAKWKARAEAAEIKVDGLQAEVDTLKQQMAGHV
jgi:peptidoglycan hydrolase CwlO-like protein